MPAYSCIIPTFNRPARTVEAVQSVLAQTHADLECMVVDDGSTDDTADRVAAIADPRLRVIRREHGGVSAARNAGVAVASGPWLAFLDSDDRWLPEKMERQLAWLEAHPEYRIGQTEEIWIRNGVRVNPMIKHRKSGGDIFRRSLGLCLVSPSAVVITRKLFEEVGGFDESLPACEDYDLWLRIACREKVGLLDEPLVIKHGGHSDQLSRTTPVMDRYRIRAIDKILKSGWLNEVQQEAALDELVRKCRIVASGCRRRGRAAEAKKYEDLVGRYGKALQE